MVVQLYRVFLVYSCRFAVIAIPLMAYIIAFSKSHCILLLSIYFTLKYGSSSSSDTGRYIG